MVYKSWSDNKSKSWKSLGNISCSWCVQNLDPEPFSWKILALWPIKGGRWCIAMQQSTICPENHAKMSYFTTLHIVWKLLKMSHLIFFKFWRFPPIFVLLKLTCLVTLFDHKFKGFKNSPKWSILAFLINFCPIKASLDFFQIFHFSVHIFDWVFNRKIQCVRSKQLICKLLSHGAPNSNSVMNLVMP